LLEFNEEVEDHWFAMHHSYTSTKFGEIDLMSEGKFGQVRLNAYDMVVIGVEVGGGSIRIFDKNLQAKMFDILGFTKKEA
jgi:aspartyl-tRNA synthetase